MAKRDEWKDAQKQMDLSKLVFLDESGVNTDMTRRYAREYKGTRAHGSAPLNKPTSTTILSSIRVDGTTVPLIFSGALNREKFKEYLREYLLPTLKPGDIVIADNLKAHKGDGISELVASVGAAIVYLRPYSPDLNPIELIARSRLICVWFRLDRLTPCLMPFLRLLLPFPNKMLSAGLHLTDTPLNLLICYKTESDIPQKNRLHAGFFLGNIKKFVRNMSNKL